MTKLMLEGRVGAAIDSIPDGSDIRSFVLCVALEDPQKREVPVLIARAYDGDRDGEPMALLLTAFRKLCIEAGFTNEEIRQRMLISSSDEFINIYRAGAALIPIGEEHGT